MNENELFNELRRQYGCGPVQFYGTDMDTAVAIQL